MLQRCIKLSEPSTYWYNRRTFVLGRLFSRAEAILRTCWEFFWHRGLPLEFFATVRNRVALLGENPRNEPQVLRIELRWMVFYHLCKPFPSFQLMTFSPPRKNPYLQFQTVASVPKQSTSRHTLPFDKMPPQTLLRCPSCSPRTKTLQSWPKQRQRWSVSGPKSHSHFRSSSRGYARKGGATMTQLKWLLHKWTQLDIHRLTMINGLLSLISSLTCFLAYHLSYTMLCNDLKSRFAWV